MVVERLRRSGPGKGGVVVGVVVTGPAVAACAEVLAGLDSLVVVVLREGAGGGFGITTLLQSMQVEHVGHLHLMNQG